MVSFRGIEITEEKVRAAFARFDREYPQTDQYDNWLEKDNYKFYIEDEDHIYPPKLVLSYITGLPVQEFSGGDQANSVFEDLGFNVRKKRFWVITPYDSTKRTTFAHVWKYDLENNTIAVGWRELGNISGLNREEYDRLYAATYPEGHSHNRESFWQFWHEIEVGDTIIARVGRKNIIGIGKVTKTVYYDKRQGETRVRDPHADVYANFIGVTWQEKPIKLAAIEFPIFPIWQIDAKKYLSYLMKVEEPPPPPPPPGAEPISPLLYKKKQIILYGPPGTGKTYSTRLLAVSLIGDYPSELPEYESEDNSKEESVLAIDNEIFSALDAQISSLNGVAIRTKPSMRCYYSLSTKGNRMKGLAWLEHPGKSGEFKVHLRKQNDGSFPEDMIAKVKDFNDNGWGGYPVFSVKEKQDVSPAMDLINFAYQNF